MKDELTVLLIQAQMLALMIIAYAKRVLSEEEFEEFIQKAKPSNGENEGFD